MSRAAQLWADNADLAEACRTHPFVQGIATGELARDGFVFYVEQDAFFLGAFSRAYALAFAKAPDVETMQQVRELLDGVFEELRLHHDYAARWDADLTPEPSPATSAYTDFLLRVAWSEPIGHIFAAMTPCMRLYAHLGQQLVGHVTDDSPYREWVDTYNAPEFEALAGRMEALLDRFDDGGQQAARHYRAAMEREYDFFDQAGGIGGR